MDGLVSTGKQFPCTILKKIFAIPKIFLNYFINIFIWLVDKETAFSILFIQENQFLHLENKRTKK
jgi:hypothetical protein